MSEGTSGSRFDAYEHQGMTTGSNAPSVTVVPLVAGSIAANRARYLSGLTLAELADHAGALAAECSARGIPVAVELGTVQARIEARAEAERTVAMIAACGHGQAGGHVMQDIPAEP
jgi:hypothetical protein